MVFFAMWTVIVGQPFRSGSRSPWTAPLTRPRPVRGGCCVRSERSTDDRWSRVGGPTPDYYTRLFRVHDPRLRPVGGSWCHRASFGRRRPRPSPPVDVVCVGDPTTPFRESGRPGPRGRTPVDLGSTTDTSKSSMCLYSLDKFQQDCGSGAEGPECRGGPERVPRRRVRGTGSTGVYGPTIPTRLGSTGVPLLPVDVSGDGRGVGEVPVSRPTPSTITFRDRDRTLGLTSGVWVQEVWPCPWVPSGTGGCCGVS